MPTKLAQVRQQVAQLPQQQFWNVSKTVGQFLCNLTSQLNAQRLLEIGTSSGYSALWFTEALQQTGGHLWTVESHTERFQLAKQHFEQAQVRKLITQIKGHAPEILSDHPELNQLDLAFFDATKKEYHQYLDAVLPLLADNGLIIADNVRSHYAALPEFIETIQGLPDHQSLLNWQFGTGLLAVVPQSQTTTYHQLLNQITPLAWTDTLPNPLANL